MLNWLHFPVQQSDYLDYKTLLFLSVLKKNKTEMNQNEFTLKLNPFLEKSGLEDTIMPKGYVFK